MLIIYLLPAGPVYVFYYVNKWEADGTTANHIHVILHVPHGSHLFNPEDTHGFAVMTPAIRIAKGVHLMPE